MLHPPVPQPGEMEDVVWLHRDWLAWAVRAGPQQAGGFGIPGPYSLANRLIHGWLDAGAQLGGEWAGASFPQVRRGLGVRLGWFWSGSVLGCAALTGRGAGRGGAGRTGWAVAPARAPASHMWPRGWACALDGFGWRWSASDPVTTPKTNNCVLRV